MLLAGVPGLGTVRVETEQEQQEPSSAVLAVVPDATKRPRRLGAEDADGGSLSREPNSSTSASTAAMSRLPV